jgi:hypothetical protein
LEKIGTCLFASNKPKNDPWAPKLIQILLKKVVGLYLPAFAVMPASMVTHALMERSRRSSSSVGAGVASARALCVDVFLGSSFLEVVGLGAAFFDVVGLGSAFFDVVGLGAALVVGFGASFFDVVGLGATFFDVVGLGSAFLEVGLGASFFDVVGLGSAFFDVVGLGAAFFDVVGFGATFFDVVGDDFLLLPPPGATVGPGFAVPVPTTLPPPETSSVRLASVSRSKKTEALTRPSKASRPKLSDGIRWAATVPLAVTSGETLSVKADAWLVSTLAPS